jgi:hypothetical protein
MSGRFVRASSYRHVFGDAAKPEKCFLNLPIQTAGDGNFVASNGKWIVFSVRGGGGPVNILANDKPGRFSNPPKALLHKAKVLDFEFSPFDRDILATCAEDANLAITRIPDEGVEAKNNIAPQAMLHGHEKKVIGLHWHPTASNVIASADFAHKVKVWNVETQQATLDYATQHTDALNHIRWNRDGTLLGTTCKDKKFRLFDPRQQEVAQVCAAFAGSKKASLEFVSKNNQIVGVGFTKSSMRQIKIWDVRNLAAEAHVEDLDQSAGVLIPFYDHDTSILFVGGKGDSSIKYFEMVGGSPYMHFLSAYSDTKSQKGFNFTPKTACDTTKCEIAHCIRIVGNDLVPVSFQVPRKAADQFQSDLFPDAYAGIAAQTADEYFAGGNVEPTLTSMRPGEMLAQTGTADIVAKATYAELEEQLAAAQARIAELEAQLAA